MRHPCDVKTAQARAKIAIALLKRPGDATRRLDDCFEMFDGDEVYRLILRQVPLDQELAAALRRRGLLSWLNEASMLAAKESQRESQPDLFGGEPQQIHRKLQIESDAKERQLDLIPGMNDAPGQLVMFSVPGMPEEFVFKPEE